MSISILGVLLIPVTLFLTIPAIALQIWLSLRKSRWPGLVLPLLSLALQAVLVLTAVLYGRHANETNGPADILNTRIGWIILIILVIGLVVDLIIFGVCRQKIKRDHQQELKKMNIQDLA